MAPVGSDYCHLHQDQRGYVTGAGYWPSEPPKESTIGNVLGCLTAIGMTLAALWCLGVAIWLVVELIRWLT